jgi:hypothetical protein
MLALVCAASARNWGLGRMTEGFALGFGWLMFLLLLLALGYFLLRAPR